MSFYTWKSARSRISVLKYLCILNFGKHWQYLSNIVKLPSIEVRWIWFHHQCVRVPVSSNTCKHRVLSNLLNSANLIESKSNITVFLFCILLMMNMRGGIFHMFKSHWYFIFYKPYCLPHWIVGLLLLICGVLFVY